MRLVLSEKQIMPEAISVMEKFHSDIVKYAIEAVNKHEWVVIGMTGNPFVKKARKHLEGKGLKFTYIEHGSYLKGWKTRLAIKLWSGWPTFPQIFHKGKLVGGCTDLKKYLP